MVIFLMAKKKTITATIKLFIKIVSFVKSIKSYIFLNLKFRAS